MNPRFFHISILCILLSGTISKAELHTWITRNGGTLKAKFIKEKNGIVFLKTKEGKTKTIQISKLSADDQKRIKEQTTPLKKKTTQPSPILVQLFGKKILDHRKRKVDVSVLANKKIIGIYFSAHWCPYCVKLTPKLITFRNKLIKQGKSFEIVFVSADNSKSDMYHYMKVAKMPWYVVPYKNKHAKALMKKYQISGFPTLIIIDSSGKLLFKNGTGYVTQRSPEKAYKQWIKKSKQ